MVLWTQQRWARVEQEGDPYRGLRRARVAMVGDPELTRGILRWAVVRSAALENRPQALPYVAYVSSAYRSDIINELCQFFMDHNVELENLTCDTYQAPQTGGTMLNATFTVTLPAGTQISWLRDQFLDFADAMNLDALIEPWRPQNPM